jgi:hypothetical protein
MIVLALAIVVVIYPFVHAITQGSYFGECDHAQGSECRIIHVFGIVMHKDASAPEAEAPPEPGGAERHASEAAQDATALEESTVKRRNEAQAQAAERALERREAPREQRHAEQEARCSEAGAPGCPP